MKRNILSLVLVTVTLFVVGIESQTTPMTANVAGVSITFANRGSSTDFLVTNSFASAAAASNAWLAVGVNSQAKMDKANVVLCRYGSTTQFVKSYLNSGYSSSAYPNNDAIGLSNTALSVNGNNLTCSFTRANTNTDSNYISVTTSATLYLVAAFGPGKLIFNH